MTPDAAGEDRKTTVWIDKGKIRLSDRIMFGLLGVAVFSQENVGQSAPESFYLSFAGEILPINQWWVGRMTSYRWPLVNTCRT